MGIQLKNNAVGYLATAISASDTGAVLQTGNGASFPVLGAGDYFYATLESTGGTTEVVKATARSGDSLTIARAQEGTTAQSFAAGSRFELRVTESSVQGGQYTAAGAGAVDRTIQAKLRETVSVKDFGAVGDGVADDTAAIQAALAACDGVLYFPPGVYKFGSLVIDKRIQIDAFGATFLGRSTDNFIIKVDGDLITDHGAFAYTTNYSVFNGFSLDMTDMADASTSRGFWLVKGWGHSINAIRGIWGADANSSKYSFYVSAGCYTTTWNKCECFRMAMIGTTLENAVTTQTLIGCAAEYFKMEYCVNISMTGMTLQGEGDKLDLSYVRGLTNIGGDIELRNGANYLRCDNGVGEVVSMNNVISILDTSACTYIQGTAYPSMLLDNLSDAFAAQQNYQNRNSFFKYYSVLLNNAQYLAMKDLGAGGMLTYFGPDGVVGPSEAYQFSVGTLINPSTQQLAEFWNGFYNSRLEINSVAGGISLRAAEHTTGNQKFLSIEGLVDAANDSAAAAAGVPVDGLYRNGSVVQIRVV